jgi:hypothetical protein
MPYHDLGSQGCAVCITVAQAPRLVPRVQQDVDAEAGDPSARGPLLAGDFMGMLLS